MPEERARPTQTVSSSSSTPPSAAVPTAPAAVTAQSVVVGDRKEEEEDEAKAGGAGTVAAAAAAVGEDRATAKNPDDDGGDDKVFTVLVTGFGPFRTNYPVNPSQSAPSASPASAASPPPPPPAPKLPRVRIVVHPEPVRVSYNVVRALVPRLWSPPSPSSTSDAAAASTSPPSPSPSPPRIDLALHIGMAGSDPTYHLEQLGHRDGYFSPDVDGKLLEDEKRRKEEGDGWIWHGLPAELETDVDVKGVVSRWRELCPHSQMKVSRDAGHYLCDFIYYSSLAHLRVHQPDKRRRVVFLHVPDDASDAAVQRGKEVVLALLQAMIESELAAAAVASGPSA
ncbi:hypothetical protein DFJ73DRAFT_962129 [Zopfochytrium polystomum]|nr:hypothetical protein DFJ73DRAFT_962129 [Zopfochytrium polystomum]